LDLRVLNRKDEERTQSRFRTLEVNNERV
jgi:hypothetical protein